MGRDLYYEITAGAGEVNVTVVSRPEENPGPGATPGRPGGGWHENRLKLPGTGAKAGGVRYAVTFNEYTDNHEHGTDDRKSARRFPTIDLIAPLAGGEHKVSKKIILSRETRLLITVNLSGRFNYRIEFDGPILEVNTR